MFKPGGGTMPPQTTASAAKRAGLFVAIVHEPYPPIDSPVRYVLVGSPLSSLLVRSSAFKAIACISGSLHQRLLGHCGNTTTNGKLSCLSIAGPMPTRV